MTVFDASSLARQDLKKLKPYEPVILPGVIRMDANESPFDFPREITDHIYDHLSPQSFNRYPDPMAQDLRAALADYTGAPAECILVGNGSDEIILNLALTFATEGTVLIPTPTFSMYEVHSLVAGAQVRLIPRRDDFSLNLEQMVSEGRDRDTRLVFLCSPNNPTANEVTRKELEDLLQNTSALVVVDEAYVEFGGSSCLHLLDKHPNLAVMRSFSKYFGLAGLRVGYLIAHPSVINEVSRVKQPFNLNNFSQRAALAVLEHLPLVREIIKDIICKRDYLWKQLDNIQGFKVLETKTNFITFKTSLPAQHIHQQLIEKGILIRNVSGPGLEDYLRVSVGTDNENEAFLDSLLKVVG